VNEFAPATAPGAAPSVRVALPGVAFVMAEPPATPPTGAFVIPVVAPDWPPTGALVMPVLLPVLPAVELALLPPGIPAPGMVPPGGIAPGVMVPLVVLLVVPGVTAGVPPIAPEEGVGAGVGT
jgi:hypothetical protein